MTGNVLTFPHIFRDGRANKHWIANGRDLDGPFDNYEDAAEHAGLLKQQSSSEASSEIPRILP